MPEVSKSHELAVLAKLACFVVFLFFDFGNEVTEHMEFSLVLFYADLHILYFIIVKQPYFLGAQSLNLFERINFKRPTSAYLLFLTFQKFWSLFFGNAVLEEPGSFVDNQ